MILSSACQPQADPFPAPSGRHGERRSYTTPRDTIENGLMSQSSLPINIGEPPSRQCKARPNIGDRTGDEHQQACCLLIGKKIAPAINHRLAVQSARRKQQEDAEETKKLRGKQQGQDGFPPRLA